MTLLFGRLAAKAMNCDPCACWRRSCGGSGQGRHSDGAQGVPNGKRASRYSPLAVTRTVVFGTYPRGAVAAQYLRRALHLNSTGKRNALTPSQTTLGSAALTAAAAFSPAGCGADAAGPLVLYNQNRISKARSPSARRPIPAREIDVVQIVRAARSWLASRGPEAAKPAVGCC